MAENSSIEWCHHTQNFWIGCAKVSPGCDHCYAEVSTPARAMKVIWGANADRHMTGESNWSNPLRWNRNHDKFYAEHGTRQRVFCQSLSDVFDNHLGVVEARARMWKVIKATPNLDWLLLTKRIGNAKNMLPADWGDGYPNVWLGASIVNQEEADRDIPKLLEVPAKVRFLSMEPLLGPVRLDWSGHRVSSPGSHIAGVIDWVIVGGESGHQARPMSIQWARALRDQCAGAGVPFLFKQWGEWAPARVRRAGEPGRFAFGDYEHDPAAFHQTDEFPRQFSMFGARCVLERVGKKTSGRLLDGVQHDGYPEAA